MTGRDPDGDIDFSERELSEMNADLAGREPGEARPKRRSMLRVPSDEVPRPAQGAPFVTEPSQPAFKVDPVDDIVEHAFSNGGLAEGVVVAELALIALSDLQPAPADDEEAEAEAELEADTDPRALDEIEEDDATP